MKGKAHTRKKLTASACSLFGLFSFNGATFFFSFFLDLQIFYTPNRHRRRHRPRDGSRLATDPDLNARVDSNAKPCAPSAASSSPINLESPWISMSLPSSTSITALARARASPVAVVEKFSEEEEESPSSAPHPNAASTGGVMTRTRMFS